MSVSSHHSSALEKLLEHRFLADLTTALWRRGERQIEVLRSEVDDAGYDIVLEVGRILRHIQLKARHRGGKRRNVNLNVRLAAKPSGCVVWMDYDPPTLELGPFLWFGGAPGEPLPGLGDRVGRHTKGNKDGEKLPRPDQRIVRESAFEIVSGIDELVERLFGPPHPSLRAAISGEGADAIPQSNAEADLERLRVHLAMRTEEVAVGTDAPGWHQRVLAGDFRAIPTDFRYDTSHELANLIDGYGLVGELGLGDYMDFFEAQLRDADQTGTWPGSGLVLWITLFLWHRADRQAGEWADENAPLLEALYQTLRARLIAEGGVAVPG